MLVSGLSKLRILEIVISLNANYAIKKEEEKKLREIAAGNPCMKLNF